MNVLIAALHSLGLPAPEPEYRFARDAGRKWAFDLAWPALLVAFEREGGTWTGGRHIRGKGYERDCEKYSEAAIRGWVVIRATTDMIADGRALALLERALRVAVARGVKP